MRILPWLRLKLKMVNTGRYNKKAHYPLGTKYIDRCGETWRYYYKVKSI